ncbi:uncharacterized protein LOC131685195 [Topomyia yanbarensis]|uniref:uncharacterized protein LOC131685195 n=1 Tax=Topomyia yanbarensis TaxID=2498891 RepID=UPI00273C9480|nr:uncharacterized protein LOC131685195 [Topomyia yanbarensis]
MSITATQLNAILSACEYETVDSNLASIVVRWTNGAIRDPNEAAMFIAHLIYESDGFQNQEESDAEDQPYAPYHGRGFIQLTWEANYCAASRELYGNDCLVQNPDLVLDDLGTSMDVSLWFWKHKVRPAAAPFTDFYQTTKVMNGVVETSSEHRIAKIRYSLYLKAAEVLGVANLASEG